MLTSRSWNSSRYAWVTKRRAPRCVTNRSRGFPPWNAIFRCVFADGTPFANVAATIRSLGIVEVSAIDAVDVFRGKHLPTGKFSLLVRVTFESHVATLTEAQLTDFSLRA